jgi:hypothetical protein
MCLAIGMCNVFGDYVMSDVCAELLSACQFYVSHISHVM